MSKIKNTGITDKWGFRYTFYVATAALKDFCNYSLWRCLHLMPILRSQYKNADFLMILASLRRSKCLYEF